MWGYYCVLAGLVETTCFPATVMVVLQPSGWDWIKLRTTGESAPSDLRDAVKKLDEGMKGTMADYQIASVAETAIMDVYPYEAKEVPISNTQISEGADSPLRFFRPA